MDIRCVYSSLCTLLNQSDKYLRFKHYTLEAWRLRTREVDEVINAGHGDASLCIELSADIRRLQDITFLILDDDTSSFLELVVEIKKRRNACVPLFRIPPETLLEIAHILANIWFPFHSHSRDVNGSLDWIMLSHVCAALCIPLINDCTLWADVICVFPKAAAEFLFRSRQAPLVLDFGGRCRSCQVLRTSFTTTLLPFMFEHVTQARVFKVAALNRDWLPPLDPLLSSELPFLEELDWCIPGRVDGTKHQHDTIFVLPAMRAPRLRSLRLAGFNIPFDPTIPTTLRLMPSQDQLRSNIHLFLTVLRSCSASLHDLELKHWLPQMLSESRQPAIPFPLLRTLYIEDDLEQAHALWTQITTPANACVTFHFRSAMGSLNPKVYSDVLQWFTPNESIASRIHGLGVEHRGAHGFTLTLATYSGSQHPFSSTRYLSESDALTVPLRLIFGPEFQGLMSYFRPAVHRAIDLFNLAYVEYLVLAPPDVASITTDEWRHLLEPLSKVHTFCLYASATDLRHFLAALSVGPPLLLPSLRSLWLETEKCIGRGLTPGALLKVLWARRGAGVVLERLRFDHRSLYGIDKETEDFSAKLRGWFQIWTAIFTVTQIWYTECAAGASGGW
jgi:hypothetical protein